MPPIGLFCGQDLPSPVVPLPNKPGVAPERFTCSEAFRTKVLPKTLRSAKCGHTAGRRNTGSGQYRDTTSRVHSLCELIEHGRYSKLVEEVSIMGLAEKTCVPCRGGVPPLTTDQIRPLASQVDHWNVVDNHHIEKEFQFSDFKTALDFVNRVGNIAEEQGHHPDIYLAWGKAQVKIWTHKINGLTESDFILAAKIDQAA